MFSLKDVKTEVAEALHDPEALGRFAKRAYQVAAPLGFSALANAAQEIGAGEKLSCLTKASIAGFTISVAAGTAALDRSISGVPGQA